MISGSDLRDARSRAGLTQEQLAERLNVTLRSVGNWERSKVPPNREAVVRDLLADHMGNATESPLRQASDVALLAELGRRLAERGTGDGGTTRQKMSEGTGGSATTAEPVPSQEPRRGRSQGPLGAEDEQRSDAP